MIRAIACLLPLALSACASTGDYPSLARRPAERITGSADVVTPTSAPPPLAPPSAQTTTRLAQLVEQARAAHQRFAARRGSAEQLINRANGAAVASESWSMASVALSDLETARSDAMIALGALDELYASELVQAAEGGSAGDAAASKAAHAEVEGWVAEEDRVLDGLRGRLRS